MIKRKTFTDIQLAEKHSEGLTNKELSEHFKVTPEAINYRLKKLSLKKNKSRIEKQREQKSLVFELHAQGKTAKEIEKETNISDITIRSWIKKSGRKVNKSEKIQISDKKIKRIIELFKENKSLKEISEILNVSEPTVRKYIRQSDQIDLDTKMNLFERKKDDLIKLHAEGFNWNQIAEKLDVSLPSVNRWAKELELKANYTHAEYHTKRRNKITVQLDGFAHHAFIGHCLGDGHLSKSSNTSAASGSFAHSLKQEDYFDHKYELFKPLCRNIKYRTKKIDDKIHNYKSTHMIACPYLTGIYNNLYIHEQEGTHNKKRGLSYDFLRDYNAISLAYHYMDDGHKNTSSYCISTCALSKEECIFLSNFLFGRFNLECRVQSDNTIYIRKNSRDIFTKLVSPYIIPSMQYKLH